MILYPPLNQTAFYILGCPVKFYGLIMSFAIFSGIYLSGYFFKKYNAENDKEQFYDSYFPVIIFSIIGARIFYVLGNLNYYLSYKDEIIKINHGGISIWGAIIFAIAALYFYCKKEKTSFLNYLDFYSLVMPLCQAIGRWGNYFNREAYGKPANGFIKLYIEKQYRLENFENCDYFEPAFLYESILNLILFIILLYNFKKLRKIEGLTFFYYIFCYSLIRILIENIRIDSILNILNIPCASVISIFALIVSLFFIIKLTRRN